MKKHIWIPINLILVILFLHWSPVRKAITPLLNQWAVSSSVFGLRMMDYWVIREGNTIYINDGKTSEAFTIIETCNGLSVITAFLITNSLIILLIRRPLWEKLIVLVSSIPIALFCNTIRLIIFMIIHPKLSGFWKNILHDFGGYVMMPLGIILILVELWLLKNIMIEEGSQEKSDIVIATAH